MHLGTIENRSLSPVEMEGVKDAYISILLGNDEGVPNFIMRQFRLAPGGHTPQHDHSWEHEIFVVRGRGTLMVEGKHHSLRPGTFALVEPGENHQFTAADDSELVFLCIVPRKD